jgi:hypothetical protein
LTTIELHCVLHLPDEIYLACVGTFLDFHSGTGPNLLLVWGIGGQKSRGFWYLGLAIEDLGLPCGGCNGGCELSLVLIERWKE